MTTAISFENAATASLNIQNEELKNYTEKIFEYGFNMRQNALRIASILAIVRNNAETLCAEFEGKTASDKFTKYGETVIGLKRANLYSYAKVGDEFLNANGETYLYEPEDSSFTISQLQLMLPLGKEKAIELTSNHVITPALKAAEIRQLVKEHDPKKAEKEAKAEKRDKAAKAKEDAKQAAEDAILGKLVATIELRVRTDGRAIVKLNGEDITTTNLGKYIIKNAK